jgi:hypothetical protein
VDPEKNPVHSTPDYNTVCEICNLYVLYIRYVVELAMMNSCIEMRYNHRGDKE